MRKLIFAITKQCDDVVSEEAHHLDTTIFFISAFISLILYAMTISSIIVDAMNLAFIFLGLSIIPSMITLIRIMSESASLSNLSMLEDLSYEKLSESENRKILYDRKTDESSEVNLALNVVKADRQYRSDEKYSLQYVQDDVKSEEFAHLYYRVSGKIIYHSHSPLYVNQIQIDALDEIDLPNRFTEVKIDRIEEFDAEVKLSFEGREKIKTVKMIDIFFKVQNVEESKKKQSVYDEIVERSK